MSEFEAMTKEVANEISKWKYEGIYNLYSFEENAETIEELLNGEYYFLKKDGYVLAYICIGNSAQIPIVEENIYENKNFTDIGLGLNPPMCGRGYGNEFIFKAIDFLGKNFDIVKLRLSVASFNKRAIGLYKKLDFKDMAYVHHSISNELFVVMVRE